MSHETEPPSTAPDEPLLRRYLLGDAAADEVERVERHLFADPEALARIEIAEADLLDAAARGELSPAEHRRVVARLASSPAGRARLAFARDLLDVADGNSDTQPGLLRVPSLAPPARPERRRTGWPRRTATVAAGVALAAGTAVLWLTLQTGGSPAPGSRTRQASPARAALATAILELSLAAGREGEALPTLRLAAGTRSVELRIQLEMEETYRAYRTTLHGAGGRTVASARDLKPRLRAGVLEIALDLAAAELRPGRYEVTVEGERTGAEPELVGSREFAVEG